MRLYEFIQSLNESRADTILAKQGDALLAKAQQNHEADSAEEVINQLLQIDPSRNKQNLQWLVTQYLRSQFRLEDASRVNDELQKFEHIKNKLEQKDIGKYTYYTLSDLIDKEFNVELADDDTAPVDGSEIKVLYDGPLGNLSIPLTQEASCELGRGTKWCTAAQKDNMFDRYNKDGPLYIWRDKSGEKYQFHFARDELQFMDDKDRPISKALLDYFRTENPVTSKLFKKYETEIITDPKTAYLYAKYTLNSRWPSAEAVIATSPKWAVYYACDIIKDRWPEVEAVIATDPNTACLYALHVIKGRWPEAEAMIATDPEYAYIYARFVLNSRWPEAEAMIATHPASWKEYKKHFKLK